MRKYAYAALVFCAAGPAFAGPVEDMIAVDRDFAKMAEEEGIPAAFAAYAAEDVHMFPDGGQPYSGREAMIAQFANWPEDATLRWAPAGGMAAEAGDFGFTWGRYVYTASGENGPVEGHGKYVSIWRKETDGAWKFVADIGNANPAPEAQASP